MPDHKLTITYDDATGAVHVNHRVTVDIAGHAVSHAEPITLADETKAALTAWLKEILDFPLDERGSVRDRAGAVATIKAIQHVAAVTGKLSADVKQIKVGGSVGPAGEAKA